MRTLKTFLNLSSSLLNTFVSLVFGLWATPYVLRWIGKDSFGAFRALIDLTGYFALFEFGFFGTLLMKFAEYSRHDRKENAEQIFAFGFKYYIKLSLVALVAAAILFPFLGKFIPVQSALHSDLNLAYLVLIVSLLFFPFQTFKAYNEANQKSYMNNRGILFQTLLTILLSLVFAKLGFGIMGQALALVFGLLIANIYAAKNTGLHIPGTLKKILSTEHISTFHKLRFSTFINELCGRSAVLSDNLIISIVLGAARVPTFHLTQRLINITQNQLQNISQASWSSLSELFHQNEMERFRERIYDLTKFVTIASVGVLVGLAIFNERLITIWVGPEYYGGLSLTLLTVVNAFTLPILSVWGWCFFASGKYSVVTPMMLIQAIVNVVVSFVATSRVGILGPTIGTSTAYFLIPCIWIPLLLKKHFQISVRTLFTKVATPAFLGILIFVPLFQNRSFFLDWHWYTCLMAMTLIAVLYFSVGYILLLDKNEKSIYKARVVMLMAHFERK
jgi:O-antigen/teichoic acid export membrane protein